MHAAVALENDISSSSDVLLCDPCTAHQDRLPLYHAQPQWSSASMHPTSKASLESPRSVFCLLPAQICALLFFIQKTLKVASTMAELGAVVAITQLAGQVFTCANSLCSLVKQIKVAPKKIEYLLREISIIADILQSVPPKSITGSEAVEKSLRYTAEVLEELHGTLTGVNVGSKQTGFKAKLKMGNFVVFKQEEVHEMVDRLRAAHNILQTAVMCHGL